VRRQHPGIRVIVHPEVSWDVVQAADDSGSTEYIIKTVKSSPAGSMWAVGTEVHLVNRLAREVAPERRVCRSISLVVSARPCFECRQTTCSGFLKSWSKAACHNRITVPDDQKYWTKVALDRMLSIQ
jgi:quinolinate synthase